MFKEQEQKIITDIPPKWENPNWDNPAIPNWHIKFLIGRLLKKL